MENTKSRTQTKLDALMKAAKECRQANQRLQTALENDIEAMIEEAKFDLKKQEDVSLFVERHVKLGTISERFLNLLKWD